MLFCVCSFVIDSVCPRVIAESCLDICSIAFNTRSLFPFPKSSIFELTIKPEPSESISSASAFVSIIHALESTNTSATGIRSNNDRTTLCWSSISTNRLAIFIAREKCPINRSFTSPISVVLLVSSS